MKKYISEIPELLKEWDFDENEKRGLSPDRITEGSERKVFWICPKGHRYQAMVLNRTRAKSGCPYCAGKRTIVGETDFATLFPKLLEEWDYEKNTKAPQEYMPASNKKVWWKCKDCGFQWETSVQNRTRGSSCPSCMQKQRARSRISTLIKKNGSLADLYPGLVREWDDEKNQVRPEEVTENSNRVVWWKCPVCGYSYKKAIYARSQGMGCPVCAGKKVLEGYNDLQTKYPSLAAEWCYDKNGELTPKQVFAGSSKKVWWRCQKCGYEWESVIYSRSKGCGCPVCSNRVAIRGYNDFATLYPELVSEWDFSKNGDLRPEELVPGTNKAVWWKCKICGYEWRAAVSSRVFQKAGCPKCGKEKAAKSRRHRLLGEVGSLKETRPELAKEWDYERNSDCSPEDFSAGSDKKVWWICERGHHWKTTISSRASGRGCPICRGEKSSSFPEHAILFYLSQVVETQHRYKLQGRELDIYVPSISVGIEYNGRFYHRNRSVQDSAKKAFFAEQGIRVVTVVEGSKSSNRIEGDNLYFQYVNADYYTLADPIRLLLKELKLPDVDIDIQRDSAKILEQYLLSEKANSLAVQRPELAKQWNYERNGLLTPEKISYGSKKKVWWVCNVCGYEWRSAVCTRLRNGCPRCAGFVAEPGENDLLSQYPNIAAEWHKDNAKSPSEVRFSSRGKVLWKCSSCGHEWSEVVCKRVRGAPCPSCGKVPLKENK